MKFTADTLKKHKGVYDLVFCDRRHADDALRLLSMQGALAFIGDSPSVRWAIDNDLLSFRFFPTYTKHSLNAPKGRSSLLSRSRLSIRHPLVYDGASCTYQHHWIRELQASRILVVGSRVNDMVDSLRAQDGAQWVADLHIIFMRDR